MPCRGTVSGIAVYLKSTDAVAVVATWTYAMGVPYGVQVELQLTAVPPGEQAHHFVATAVKPETPVAELVAMVCIIAVFDELPAIAPY